MAMFKIRLLWKHSLSKITVTVATGIVMTLSSSDLGTIFVVIILSQSSFDIVFWSMSLELSKFSPIPSNLVTRFVVIMSWSKFDNDQIAQGSFELWPLNNA